MAGVSQVSRIAPEQLAPWTEEEVQQHLAAGKLVEGLQHMSPKYRPIERVVYVIDCPFPARFDEEKREWLLDEGAISWDEVLARWRARGPMNRDYVRTLQRGYQTTLLRKAA